MVSISRKRINKHSRRTRGTSKFDTEKMTTIALVAVGAFVVLWTVMSLASGGSDGTGSGGSGGGVGGVAKGISRFITRKKDRPDLHLDNLPNSESYNAIALDILTTLKCTELLNKTTSYSSHEREFQDFAAAQQAQDRDVVMQEKLQQQDGGKQQDGEEGHFRRRRRLQEEQDRFEEDNNNEEMDRGMLDDFAGGDGGGWDGDGWDYSIQATAAHLFCLAALGSDAEQLNPKAPEWISKIRCDATSDITRQVELLDIWGDVRAEMEEDIMLKTLEISTEHERDFVNHNMLNLWAPTNDDGLDYMLNVLNEEQKTVDHGGIYGLESNLGNGKLFVDVGGGLGLTAMAVAILYPGTRIVSMEAATPNWLLQQLNWSCNSDKLVGVDKSLVLAGVGPSEKTAQMAKFMWRPSATTSTRSWTPAAERQDSDVEIRVKLKPWHTILKEAGVDNMNIDVLNVDCEGCEYNLVPALSEQEFDNIRTVMGSVHWGYIPEHKLPSSVRAERTHKKLCRHENFARYAKECCAFPDLPVQSSVVGEILVEDTNAFPPKDSVVRDIAGTLCNDFDTWAKNAHLFDVPDDWGWFRISSMADA